MRPFLCVLTVLTLTAQTRTVSDAEVRRVHRSALLIDTHNDFPTETLKGFDIGARRNGGHTDLPRLREGGVGAVFFAAYVSTKYMPLSQSAHRVLEMIDSIRYEVVEKHPNDFALALKADDIVTAHKRGKIAALIGIEGGHAIEESLRLLRTGYAAGARYMTLTHTTTLSWAGSSGDEGRANGLSAFGREVVAEMNRLGMMVDISHVSDQTFTDVLAASKAPVFASHSSCRALSNIRRNMTDEMIVALAKKGGVIQINFGCDFLSQKSADASWSQNPVLRKQLEDEVAREVSDPIKRREVFDARMEEKSKNAIPATLDDAVAHIDHIVKLAGIDAVGLGTDYDGVSCTPTGLEDTSKFANLTRALLQRGYSAAQIRKIYGGNFLRFMRAVEARGALGKPPV